MKYVVSLTLVLLCYVTEASPAPSPRHIDSKHAVSPLYSKMADQILTCVNDYRRKKGLSPLVMNNVISAEAQKHSENMAAHRVAFGHKGFQNRMKNISSQISGINATAENVAFGNMDARQVVDTWLQSPGHRQNIEGPYKLTGIGIATDSKGDLYFTEIFAAN